MITRTLFLTIIALLLINCKTTNKLPEEELAFKDNFNNNTKFDSIWEDDTAHNSPKSYSLKNNNLEITSRAKTEDRVKIKTKKKLFGEGSYIWKIYIPQYGLNEQCSIGAFIYHHKKGDKPFELDFEIGSGTKKHREELLAKPNEAIVHCTSQLSPFTSERFTIATEKWHNFKLELINKKGYYIAKWYINNKLVKIVETKIKSNCLFSVHNSLENLKFMGDKETTKEYYVLFDSFEFKN